MIKLIATGILAAAALSAQMPGMFAWWDSPIARDLKLSEEQNRKVREAVRESRERIFHLRASAEAADANLGDMMNDDTVDARKANEAIEKMVTSRAELTRAVTQMSLKLRLILTPAQWQELQRRQPRGPRPPDAPQPPRPGMQGPGGPPQPGNPPAPPPAPLAPRPQEDE